MVSSTTKYSGFHVNQTRDRKNMPRKKIRAARVKKKHRDASSSGASSSEEEGAGRASAPASPKKDRKKLSFKEREALRRQASDAKRRAKMQCRLCGRSGHVRRECPVCVSRHGV